MMRKWKAFKMDNKMTMIMMIQIKLKNSTAHPAKEIINRVKDSTQMKMKKKIILSLRKVLRNSKKVLTLLNKQLNIKNLLKK